MRHLLILTLLGLSACGFHLRGSYVIPGYLQTIQVRDASPATRIAPELKRALREAGVTVTEIRAQADAVLQLHAENLERRVLAVGADGKAQEYGLRYSVAFSVLGPDGTPWLSKAGVSASQSLRFDEGAVLGAAGEQEQLLAEMRREAVRGILGQLARVKPVTAQDVLPEGAGP